MDEATYSRLCVRSDIFKALGHPARLFIVEQLADGEKCVQELTEKLDVDVSTVSRHLSVMKHTGIVNGDKRGNKVFYSINVPCIMNFMSCIEAVIEQR